MKRSRSDGGGTVIRFHAPSRVQPVMMPAGDDTSAGERGRILLFTGVRYQRLDDLAAFNAAAYPQGRPDERLIG